MEKLIKAKVDEIYDLAMFTMYEGTWDTKKESERVKFFISEYFSDVESDDDVEDIYSNIVDRVMLLDKKVKKEDRVNGKAYLPTPSIYFDSRNNKGFVLSQQLLEKFEKARSKFINNTHKAKLDTSSELEAIELNLEEKIDDIIYKVKAEDCLKITTSINGKEHISYEKYADLYGSSNSMPLERRYRLKNYMAKFCMNKIMSF